jgi:hypothetical protein
VDEVTGMTTTASIDGRCPDCGFHPGDLAPSDIHVAVRSLARRWRELLSIVVESEDDGEALLRQRAADGWSAVDRVSHVTDTFTTAAGQLEQVWEHDTPTLDAVADADTGRGGGNRPLGELLDRLGGGADRLARAVDRYDGDQWGRAGRRDGHTVTALYLAREAVHDASHHLRACRDDLSERCGRPLDEEEGDA